MSVIAQSELERLIGDGVIKIEPFSPDQIGPGSIDLHLGTEFTVFRKVREVFHISDETDHRMISETITVHDFFVLMPGESALAKTVEKITLPDDICGRLEGRSRFSRLGLLVHITASFMHPGISNHQMLEMYNASPIPLAVHPGTKICQFIFEKTIGRGHYSGRFANQ
ncbi:MAG: dCTP deaminase [Candidatus Aureabacteria bacterium]|nr:dCTP deaminase [Candidatus Auribacterota bacterium]